MGRDEDAAKVRFPPPLIYLLCIALGFGLSELTVPLSLDALGLRVRLVLGAAMVVMGGAAVILAGIHFVRTGQAPEPWKTTPEIIAKGIYTFSRNPMYLGMALVQAGTGVLANRLWIVLLVPLSMLVTTVIAIRPEESYLEAKFGEGYLRYKARVRRWL